MLELAPGNTEALNEVLSLLKASTEANQK
jgi:hypothetical protein